MGGAVCGKGGLWVVWCEAAGGLWVVWCEAAGKLWVVWCAAGVDSGGFGVPTETRLASVPVSALEGSSSVAV